MKKYALLVMLAVLALAPVAQANPVLVSRPEMTFGGTGIPNHAVAVAEGTYRLDNFVLGLTAHQRCAGVPQVCGDVVTNDGIDTFFAAAGTPFGANLASWNFGYYVQAPAYMWASFTFSGTGLSDTTGWMPLGNLPNPWQDSQNFGFSFLGLTGFNANASGLYNITLALWDNAPTTGALGSLVGSTTIHVQVGEPEPVPEPATMSLLGLGLAGLAAARRRNRK